MTTVVLKPDVWETLERDAQAVAKTVDEVVNEALADYLHKRHRAKLEKETAAYEAMHLQLKANYLGQWVAIHGGQLVDHDQDKAALYRRVRTKFGRAIVLIREVKEDPEDVIWLRTPSYGKRSG